MMLALLASLIGVGVPQTAAAPPPSPVAAIEPSGKWVVDYEEGMCVLSRRYGAGDAAIDVGFRPMATLDRMQIVMVFPTGSGASRGRATVGLDDDLPVSTPFVGLALAGGRGRVQSLYVEDEWLERTRTATTLTVTANGVPIALRLRGVGPALTALKTCQDQLLRRWGLDPAAVFSPKRARLRADQWFARVGDFNYPSDALKAKVEGGAVAILAIRADGTPDKCSIVQSAGHPSLDQRTCVYAMRYARFQPARDGQDRPMRGSFIVPIRWTLASD